MSRERISVATIGGLDPQLPVLADGSLDYGQGVIGPSTRDIAYFNSLPDFDRGRISSEVEPLDMSNMSRRDLDRGSARARLRRSVMALTAAAGIGAIVAACGGKGETSNPPTESPTVGPSPSATIEPTPSATEAPTIVPTPKETPTATPQEKLYGPAPTQEELRSSLVAAFGGATYKYFDRDIELCSDNYLTLNTGTVSTEVEAEQLLSYCLQQADHLRSEGNGGTDAINNGLDQLRNSYFGLVEKLVQRGLLSQAHLEPGQVEHTTELYFSHTK